MKTIRVDMEVWEGLKKLATPLEDTPNSVIRRLLQLSEAVETPVERFNRYLGRVRGRTRQEEYRLPMLGVLVEMGGKGEVPLVLREVRRRMNSMLKPVDLESLKSGAMPRWENAAQWERAVMVKEGLLRSDSPRGIWEVTELGRKYLSEHGRKGRR